MASSSNSRPAKLRKLNNLRTKVPHLTATALAGVLDEIQQHGVPELHGRMHVAEACDEELAQHDFYGPLITTVPAVAEKPGQPPIDIVVANPLSLIQAAYGSGGSYYDLVQRTVRKHDKLSAIIYFDEVVPGDPVTYANKRKIWVCYVSFAQFGPRILANEHVWLPVIELRTSVTSTLSAGISQVCRIIMKQIFLNSMCDVLHLGLMLKGPDDHRIRVRLELAYLLQDGAAHKYVFHTKGDKGTKFCALCKNCYAVDTQVVDPETDETVLTASVIYEHECNFADCNDIIGSISRLRAKSAMVATGDMSKAEFERWEQAAGYNWQPEGLLQDTELIDKVLRPSKHYCHDWMHTMFVVGVFQTVITLVLKAVKDAIRGLNMPKLYEMLYKYVQLWVHPGDKKNDSLHECFTAKRLESNLRAEKFKCKASDGLGLYCIIALWLQMFIAPTGKCGSVCTAYLDMCYVIDLFIACSQENHGVSPDDLSKAINAFLKSCIDAGWKQHMHPKFHWLNHFPNHLHNHTFLVSCWVHERLHRMSKRYGNDIRNTIHFDNSLLKQVLNEVLAKLKEPGLFDVGVGLVKPAKATKKAIALLTEVFKMPISVQNCIISRVARIRFGSCCRKDVVFIESHSPGSFVECGEVWLHAEAMGCCISIVSMWSMIDHDKPKGLVTWRKVDNPVVVATADLLSSVVYRALKDNVVATLVPIQLR